jgi:hypothetical protein
MGTGMKAMKRKERQSLAQGDFLTSTNPLISTHPNGDTLSHISECRRQNDGESLENGPHRVYEVQGKAIEENFAAMSSRLKIGPRNRGASTLHQLVSRLEAAAEILIPVKQ